MGSVEGARQRVQISVIAKDYHKIPAIFKSNRNGKQGYPQGGKFAV